MLLFQSALTEALLSSRSMQCVVHMAQAAEILLKARIADDHHLLIFSKIPEQKINAPELSLEYLLEKGNTLSYDQLPDRLWATTGVVINNLQGYKEFGKLRNQIIHISMTTCNDLNMKALEFGLNILDPLVERFWGKSVIDFILTNSWDNSGNEICFGVTEKFDSCLINKFNTFPSLRRLLGEDASNDWVAYMKRQENDRIVSQKFDYINVSNNDELADLAEAENEMRRQEESRWQAFLEEFMSA